MNCIIVDDDELSIKLIESCVARTEFLTLAASFTSAKEAIKYLKINRTDLIFLDVEMPETSGLEMIEQLKTVPQIILVTGKRDYAVEAFEYDVTDYILKPFDYERFKKAVVKARENHERNSSNMNSTESEFFIKKDSKLIKINMEEIAYVEALADYVNIFIVKNNSIIDRLTILSTMKAVESKLPALDFVRVHRSYIVRLDKIKTMEDNNIVIADKSIPVSRANKEFLIKKLKRF